MTEKGKINKRTILEFMFHTKISNTAQRCRFSQFFNHFFFFSSFLVLLTVCELLLLRFFYSVICNEFSVLILNMVLLMFILSTVLTILRISQCFAFCVIVAAVFFLLWLDWRVCLFFMLECMGAGNEIKLSWCDVPVFAGNWFNYWQIFSVGCMFGSRGAVLNLYTRRWWKNSHHTITTVPQNPHEKQIFIPIDAIRILENEKKKMKPHRTHRALLCSLCSADSRYNILLFGGL